MRSQTLIRPLSIGPGPALRATMPTSKGFSISNDRAGSRVAATLVLLGAASLFVMIARRVSTSQNEPLDQRVRDWAQEHHTPVLDAAVRPVTFLSIPILVVTMTTALAWWLRREDRSNAARAVALTPLAAAFAAECLTRFLSLRNPPHAGDAPHGEVEDPSFPSGHTMGVTAEGLSIAYILLQEDLGRPVMLAGLIAWPLVVGVTRIYRDRHWLSDVLGGWTAGIGVAATGVLLYRLNAPELRAR